MIAGLVADIAMATKIAKSAKQCQFAVHNSNRSEPLLECLKTGKVFLVILDFDHCEAQAYRLLQDCRQIEGIERVSFVGFASRNQEALKKEAQGAGCHRLYAKTEFIRELDLLIARSVL